MSKEQSEEAALAQLHQWKVSGVAGAPIAPDVRRRLELQRLIQPDEYGQDSITERGEERLAKLRRMGARPHGAQRH